MIRGLKGKSPAELPLTFRVAAATAQKQFETYVKF